MDTPRLDALIELLRDDPDLCDKVLRAPDQASRAQVLQQLGFDVSEAETPDKTLLAQSLGFVD